MTVVGVVLIAALVVLGLMIGLTVVGIVVWTAVRSRTRGPIRLETGEHHDDPGEHHDDPGERG